MKHAAPLGILAAKGNTHRLLTNDMSVRAGEAVICSLPSEVSECGKGALSVVWWDLLL